MKTNPMMMMTKNSLLDLPSPASISILWNMGFMLGIILMSQIVSGLLVSMSFIPNTTESFLSMVAISRDIKMGWMTRFLHMNGASLFFVILYIHTARGIYFSSPPNQKMVWTSGVLLLLLTMATAFFGYVLPWGQMSFWGATVITGVLSAIPLVGNELTIWIWGGPSVSQPTLNRFFSLHFLTPIMILATAMIHLIFLHSKGSSNPSNTKTNLDKIKFQSLYSLKDFTTLVLIFMITLMMSLSMPNLLGDVENFNTANPLVAPIHIQPEWYFLFAYVILRSIPSKLGGVISLALSILILLVLPKKKSISMKFLPSKKMTFWTWISVVLILTWIGAKTVEAPFEKIGQFYTMLYFVLIIMM